MSDGNKIDTSNCGKCRKKGENAIRCCQKNWLLVSDDAKPSSC